MTKTTLITAIAEKQGITKKAAGEQIDEVFQVIIEGIAKDGGLSIPGFGVFEVKKMAARDGRNPLTGEAIKIAEKNKVKFKAYNVLKESVQ